MQLKSQTIRATLAGVLCFCAFSVEAISSQNSSPPVSSEAEDNPAAIEGGINPDALAGDLKAARDKATISKDGIVVEVTPNRFRLISMLDAKGKKRARFHYTSNGKHQGTSIHDAVSDELESYRIAVPGPAMPPPPPNKGKNGNLEIQDLEDYEGMVRQAGDFLFTTANFYLGWDYLSDISRDDDRRRMCISDCESTCDAGNVTMGIVCSIGAGLLAPSVVGTIAGGFGCTGFAIW